MFGAGAVCVYLLLSSQLAPRLASRYSQYREDHQLEALMAARAAAVRCRHNVNICWGIIVFRARFLPRLETVAGVCRAENREAANRKFSAAETIRPNSCSPG